MRTSRLKREAQRGTQESQNAKTNPIFEPAVTQKLHKLLAQTGLGSRREMEKLIATGLVTINGKVAEIGDRVGATDLVRIKRRIIHLKFGESLPRIILYHKPEGEIVSRNDPHNRPSVFNKLPKLKTSKWVSTNDACRSTDD